MKNRHGIEVLNKAWRKKKRSLLSEALDAYNGNERAWGQQAYERQQPLTKKDDTQHGEPRSR